MLTNRVVDQGVTRALTGLFTSQKRTIPENLDDVLRDEQGNALLDELGGTLLEG